jgi:hypothetical protein
MKFNSVLNNFTAGQWSSKMLVNNDNEQYKSACKKLINKIILKQGGAFTRPGTKYTDISTILDSATYFKIMPYRYNEVSYLLIVTHVSGVDYWYYYNCSTGVNTTLNPGYFGIGISSTYGVSIETFQYAQYEDSLIIATGSTPIFFNLNTIPFVNDYYLKYYYMGFGFSIQQYPFAWPYGKVNSLSTGTPVTFTASATTGSITITASDTILTRAEYQGRYLKLTSGGTTGICQLGDPGAFGPYNTIPATVLGSWPLPAAAAYGSASGTAWEMSEKFNATSVAVFEQRVYFGCKNKVWASRLGEPFYMMEVPLAQDPDFTAYASDSSRAFTIVPSVPLAASVKALGAAKALYIGLDSYDVSARGVQGALSPNDITLDASSSYGTAAIQPSGVDNFLATASRTKKGLKDIVYSYENEQFKAQDISFMSDELFKESPIKRMVSGILNDTGIILILREDGTVLCGTLERALGVYAWGKFSFTGTSVQIKDIVVAQKGNSDGTDAFYFAIKRTINGSTKVYLEKMASIFESTTYSTSNMFYYLDSYKEVSSPGSATISATHLAGEEVHVFADGDYKGTKTVTAGGNLVLDAIYTHVLFGKGYEDSIIPAPIAVNTQLGNSSGKVKNVPILTVTLWNSIAGKYGDPERNEYYNIITRKTTTVAQDLTPLFSGEIRLQFPAGFSSTKQIEIKNDLPFPCNILAIIADGTNYD